jgi:hypothetical protein
VAWTAFAVCLVGGLGSQAWAARPGATAPRWHVFESANFRILNYGTAPVSEQTADNCERLRAALTRQWLGKAECPAWTPKCALVLHASDQGYLREVGQGGRSTVASALVDRQDGNIVLRRIDVRATRPDWENGALGHELTHVVLADRFAVEALPRWLDEGIAILSDPHAQQQRHRKSLERAVVRGNQFRLAELLTLGDYPPPDRWGVFYGQSASLVGYLVEQQGHARFVEFAELALEHGYDKALRSVYRVGIAELERSWHRSLTSRAEATVETRPALQALGSEPTSAG